MAVSIPKYLEIIPQSGDSIVALDLGASVPPLNGTLDLTYVTDLTSLRVTDSDIEAINNVNSLALQTIFLSANPLLKTDIDQFNINQKTNLISFICNNSSLSGTDFAGLSGSLPSSIGIIQPSLAYFDCSFNNIVGVVPCLSGYTNLQYYKATNNKLAGTEPFIVPNTLTYFNVADNYLSVTDIKNILQGFAKTFKTTANNITGTIVLTGDAMALIDFTVIGDPTLQVIRDSYEALTAGPNSWTVELNYIGTAPGPINLYLPTNPPTRTPTPTPTPVVTITSTPSRTPSPTTTSTIAATPTDVPGGAGGGDPLQATSTPTPTPSKTKPVTTPTRTPAATLPPPVTRTAPPIPTPTLPSITPILGTPTPTATPLPTRTSTPSVTPSPSVTASPTPSPSPSPSPTPSPTPSTTPSPTPSPSPSPSTTASPTPSETLTATPTPSPTPSTTASPTPSPSTTASPTPSETLTATPTPSTTPNATPSPTPSGTVTATPTSSATPNATASPSPTPSVTLTATPSTTPNATPSPSPSPSVTLTATPSTTPGATPSPSPTPSVTLTATPSTTPGATPSPSPTPSVTLTATPSTTPNATPSPSPSATPNPTPSPSPSTTPNATPSPSPSPSVTLTASPTRTPDVTPFPTPTPSGTVTLTPSPSPTPGATASPSPTPSVTLTATPSTTPVATPTRTPTPSVTLTATPSTTPNATPSPSPTPSVTLSPTPSTTPNATPTRTPTPSVTLTATPSTTPNATNTPSPTPSVTLSPTPSTTPASTASPTPTPSVTLSPTPSRTPVATSTPTPTPSVTQSPTPSSTPVATSSPTPTPSRSSSPTPSPTPNPTTTPTTTPSRTPSYTPSSTPVPTPTTTPLPTPNATATPGPTTTPIATPSRTPTATPPPTPQITPSATKTPVPTATTSSFQNITVEFFKEYVNADIANILRTPDTDVRVSEYWNGQSQVAVTIIVNSGVTVGGTTSDTTLLPQTGAARNTTGNAIYFPPNVFKSLDTFTLINNGRIWGAGGKGGTGNTYSGTSGENGRAAISTPYYLNITNNGKIWAGMGGGGAGGSGWKEYAATNCYSINCNPYNCNPRTVQVLTNVDKCCTYNPDSYNGQPITDAERAILATALGKKTCSYPNNGVFGTLGYTQGSYLINNSTIRIPCSDTNYEFGQMLNGGSGIPTYGFTGSSRPDLNYYTTYCNWTYGYWPSDCTWNGATVSSTVDTCNYSGKKSGKKGGTSCGVQTLSRRLYYGVIGRYLQQLRDTIVYDTCYQQCSQNCYKADSQIGAAGGKGYGYDCRPDVVTGGIFTKYVKASNVSPSGYGGVGGLGADFKEIYGGTGGQGTSTVNNIYPGTGTSPGTPLAGYYGNYGGRAGCAIEGINNCSFTTVGEIVGYDTINQTATTINVKKTSTNTNLQTFGSYQNNVINSAYNYYLKLDRSTPLGIYDNTGFKDVRVTTSCGYAISNNNKIYFWDKSKNTTIDFPTGVLPVKFVSEIINSNISFERSVIVLGNDNKLYKVSSSSVRLMTSVPGYYDLYSSNTYPNTRLEITNVKDAAVYCYSGGSSFDLLVLGTDNKLYYGGNINKAGISSVNIGSYDSVYYGIVDSVKDKTFKSIAMGENYILAITTDNIIYAWGSNNVGAYAGTGTPADTGKLGINVASGLQYTPTVVQFASGQRPVQDLGLTPLYVYAGVSNSYILCTDGSLYACGTNRNGLNLNSTNNNGIYTVFTRVVVPSTTTKVTDVYPARDNLYYIQTTNNINTLYGVGSNSSMQLGIKYPTNVVYTTPVAVNTENWSKISVATNDSFDSVVVGGLTQINRTLTDSTAPNIIYYTDLSVSSCSLALRYSTAGYFFQPTPTRSSTPVPTPTRTSTPTPTPTRKAVDSQYFAAFALSKDQKSLLYSDKLTNVFLGLNLNNTTGNVFTSAFGILQNNYNEQAVVIDVSGPNFTTITSTDRYPILKVYQQTSSSELGITLTNVSTYNQPFSTNTYPATVLKDIVLISPPNRESPDAQRYIDDTVPKYSFIWESNGGGMFIDNNNQIIKTYPSYTFVYNSYSSGPGHATYCVSPDGEYAFIYAGPLGLFSIDVVSLRQSDYGRVLRIPLAPRDGNFQSTLATKFNLRITMACTPIDINYNQPGYMLWLSCDKNGNPGYIRIDKNSLQSTLPEYIKLNNCLVDGDITPIGSVQNYNYVKPFAFKVGTRQEIPKDVYFTKATNLTANYITSQLTLLDDMRTLIWMGAPTTRTTTNYRGGVIIDTQTAYFDTTPVGTTNDGLFFRNYLGMGQYSVGSTTSPLYSPVDSNISTAISDLIYCNAGVLAGSVQILPQLWGVHIEGVNPKVVAYPVATGWYTRDGVTVASGGLGYTKIGVGYSSGSIKAPRYVLPRLSTSTAALTCNNNVFIPAGRYSFTIRAQTGFGLPGPLQLGYIRNATQQSPFPN